MTRLVPQPTRISLTLVSEGGQRARHSVCVVEDAPENCITPAAMVYAAAVNQLADRMAVQRIQVERRRLQWNRDVSWSRPPQAFQTTGVNEVAPLEMTWLRREVSVELRLQRREVRRSFVVPATTSAADCYAVGDYIATICQSYLSWECYVVTIEDAFERVPEARAYPGARRAVFSLMTAVGRGASVSVPGVSTTRGIPASTVLNSKHPDVAAYIAVLTRGALIGGVTVPYCGENGWRYSGVQRIYHETMGR